jgi:uncharacterized membrane protein
MDTPATDTVRPSSPGGNITYALLAIVIVVAAIFAFSTNALPDHWYAVFKTIHVTLAVVWVGGGVLLTILALRAQRESDPRIVVTVARQAAFAGEKIFAPAGLIVFLMGIAMVINLHWGWGTTWIVIGLAGYVLTFLTGLLVLGPQAKRVGQLIETKGAEAAETQAAIQRILLIARVDMGVLLLVVADMVLKPFT